MSASPEEPPPRVSVVVPFFDEEDVAESVLKELRMVLGDLEAPYELVAVDDGSRDATYERILAGIAGDPQCVALRLRRNSGQTAALAAGIDRARGEVVVLLDGDGQNDPEDIPRLLEALEAGFDVASGWRRQRRDAYWTRVFPSKVANALIARLSGVPIRDLGCSLKAYRREFLEGIRLYGEMHRFLAIHAVWEGARLTELEVHHRPRTSGRSKYGLERTFKVVLDLIVMVFLRRYGTKPIYPFGGFGLLSMACGFLAALAAIAFKFAPPPYTKSFVETPLPLLVVLLVLVGVLSIMLGLLAEMLTRTWHESQAKPVYRLAEVRGGDEVERPSPEPRTSAS
ncbi:MAG: glycosyltransferase [Planctomycetota bacterium]|nr:MAG: glycosyltransferase [Planctomycetota bacterium]